MLGRVTFNSNYDLMVRRVQGATERYHKSVEQTTTGKQVNRPKDDPGAYSRILGGRAETQALEDYRTGIGTAVQEMELADSVLDTATQAMNRARELAVMGANATFVAEDRLAISKEVAALRDVVLVSANTKFNGRYIFSGFAYDQPAFDSTGTYLGDSGLRRYLAGHTYTQPTNIPGDEIFGTAGGGVDIFATLNALEAALVADSVPGVQSTLDDLDSALGQLADTRGNYGARVAQAQTLNDHYEEGKIIVTEQVSQEEDIDAAEAYARLAHLNTAMEATLQVTAKASGMSLLDYL